MTAIQVECQIQLRINNQQLLMIAPAAEEQTQPCNREFEFRAPQESAPASKRTLPRKYWLAVAALLLLLGALVGYIILMSKNMEQLGQTVARLEARLTESQRNAQDPNTKEIEVERVLLKTELKVETCLKRLTELRNTLGINDTAQTVTHFPRILWVFTEYKLQAEKMVEQFLGRNLVRIAQQSGVQVRLANSWDAYEWLSPKTTKKITKTMQNMRISQKVNQLLKVALLMEHGGMLVSTSELLLLPNLDWVFSHFNRPVRTEALVFAESYQDIGQVYQEYFLAAVPNADLVVEIFNTLCNAITLNSIKYQQLKKASYLDVDMNVTVIPDIIKNTINGILTLISPELFSVAIITLDPTQRLSHSCQNNFFRLMKQPKAMFKQACGDNGYFLHLINRSKLEEEMELALEPVDDSAKSIPTDSYWYQLLGLSQNLKYFIPTPPRQVQFCVLDAQSDQDLTLIRASFEKLKKQTYDGWTAVYFVDRVTQQMTDFMAQQNKGSNRITLVKSSGSLGRNYQLGIINHCTQKSFITILNRKDSFDSTEGLQRLVGTLQKPGVLGSFVSMNVSGRLLQPQRVYENYTKLEMNGRNPQYEQLGKILNFLKVFHSDCYKILPQFALFTHERQYYNDRFKFLEAFVQMVVNLTEKHDSPEINHTQKVKWFIKSSYDIFDVPNRIEITRKVVINSQRWEEVDRQEIAMNNYKHDVYPMTYSMDHLIQNGQSMADFAVYNHAVQSEPYTLRNKPDIIPKVIHLIWIEGEMPEGKRKVIELNQELYPDFRFKIWSKANITREAFPLSYELLMNIYSCNKFTRYSKMATMADVMRHELVYNEGGIYMDTSMLLFNRAMYKWLSYKAFLSTQHIFRHRWTQNMCIFAAMPKFPGLLRIIEHQNTNRYNIFLKDAMEIAGPADFRHFIQGYEEYDKDILILDLDGFYPITYAKDNYYQPYCMTQPANLKHKHQDEIVYRQNDMVLIKNCGKYYPYSFGKELNSLGSSWQNPRW